MVRDELLSSQGELRESKEELRAVKDELCDKTTLLDGARCEISEAVNSVERLTEECRGLHGDLHQQVTLVTQQDGVIRRLRDEACTQWVSGWLAFQKKAANAYPGLDFNLTSLATRWLRNPSLFTILENRTLLLKSTPPLHPLLLLLTPDHRRISTSIFVLFIFCWAWDPGHM